MKSIFATEWTQMNESKSEISIITNDQTLANASLSSRKLDRLPEATAWKDIDREIVQANLDLYDLTDREKRIIMLRYRLIVPLDGGLPSASGLLPYAAIGREMGLTKQRIHKILEKALSKLSSTDKESLRIFAIPEPAEGDLAAKIKQKRLMKGMPRETLAEALGTSTSYIGRIEGASEAPSIAMIRKIAHALDVKTKELLQDL